MNHSQSENIPARDRIAHRGRAGFIYGLSAYALWGVLPLYFKAIATIPAIDIVAHRILWSLPFLALLIWIARGSSKIRAALASRKTLGVLSLTALLIGGNWLLYVYAVTSGHILAASFGYYLNPLANVLLGRFVLHERLNRLQWTAVAIAGAGISVLAAGALGQLWISLTLCGSFALYGLLRKIVAADAVSGLAIETALLFPIAIAWLLWRGASGAHVMGADAMQTSLLLVAGIVSTTPLLLFTAAARKLAYSTLGMLQFIAPTLQFLIAVLLYGEPFTPAHAVAFAAIWVALGLYVTALVRAPKLPQAAE
ncbi:EamA family transporter RarD [Sphingomonas hankyongi]|uniref:EamA family transporter RarD n=1 Tax=Sphingomonas hankyongi TaxID=2908209 RepID=A0ABT0RZK5_9SPHN|nr:EamA family transporter RarD [Sphingomonas hankyongi]